MLRPNTTYAQNPVEMLHDGVLNVSGIRPTPFKSSRFKTNAEALFSENGAVTVGKLYMRTSKYCSVSYARNTTTITMCSGYVRNRRSPRKRRKSWPVDMFP